MNPHFNFNMNPGETQMDPEDSDDETTRPDIDSRGSENSLFPMVLFLSQKGL
jgi:hypothetical protein